MRRDAIPENLLLKRLDAAALAELAPMETVQLAARTVLHEPTTPAPYTYFPVTAVISLVSTMESGASAEVAMIGREGMVGLAGMLGPAESPTAAIVQVAGSAVRVPAAVVRAARRANLPVRETFDLYTEARLIQVVQTAACSRLHSVEERLARWLLAIDDRIAGDEFIVPHESIANMLGVQRPTVSMTLQRFHEQHAIERRGRAIVIAHRAGLERLSCECRRIVEQAFEKLFSRPTRAGAPRHAAPPPNGGERQTAALEAMRDIAGRLLVANIREQEAREQAEAANRSKDDFLAMVSHELRTPLNAILGWCTTLARGQGVGVGRGLSIIERNARAQLRVVDDLLDAARITSATLTVRMVRISLADVVHSAVEAIKPMADEKAVALRVSIDAAPELAGDPDRLRQVLLNVLANSLKFTDAGGSIDARVAVDGDRARVIIRDTGRGIAAAVLPHVFDRFRQGDTSSTHDGGLGLGLAICRALVELHGGTIAIDSDGENQGTTCTIELPLAIGGEILARDGGALSA